MEWEPKMPPWEITELGREDDLGHQCSVDLKLGGSGDSKDLGRRLAESDSSKRPRTIAGGVNCLVDGCNSDLSNCREYHKRHKVCEVHSKTPVVMVKGQQQRFCQQCSRFHLLMEFDQVKRSCRKRLDGHNRRRRKAQPDASNAAQFFHRSRFASAFSSEMARTGRNYLVGSLPAEDEIQVLIGPGSACALSLLSSPSQYAGGDAVAAEEGIPTGQRLADSSLFSHSSLAFVPPAAAEDVDQTGGAASGGFHSQGFFHLGIDGPSARPSDAFPFSWQ